MQWSFDLVGLWLKVEICRLNNNFAQYKEAGVSGDHDTYMHYGFDGELKTGALGTRLQLIPYYYNDSNWRDKLTNYNGTAITYDNIGNVVNDGTWWYRGGGGRQLTSGQHGSQVVRYY